MFNFFKKRERNLLPEELQLIICNRIVSILLEEYNIENEMIPNTKFIANTLKLGASIDDVMTFADEYGCTVDYLLGRTDTPYYTM